MANIDDLQDVEQGIIVTLYNNVGPDAKLKEIKTGIAAARGVFKELLEAGTGQPIGRHSMIGDAPSVTLYDQRDIDWVNGHREKLDIIVGVDDLTDYDTDRLLEQMRQEEAAAA